MYNQSHLLYSSYARGSKSKGTVTPMNCNETAAFHPNVSVRGNVMIRCRHLPANQSKPVTLFRCQFYTGFVKLFQLSLSSTELDAASLPSDLKLSATFTPSPQPALNMEDPYEDLIVSESSSLWSEVLKKKETRMNEVENKSEAFVVGTSRSSKRDSIRKNDGCV